MNIYVGLDIDDKYFTGTAITATGESISFKTKPCIKRLISRLIKISDNPKDFKICYESTYIGFSLARKLIQKGYCCDVIASSLIPALAADKIKTDRLDSEKLALYFKQGLLTKVYQPDEFDEAASHLTRLRKFLIEQIKAAKNRLKSESRIFNLSLPSAKTWNDRHVSTLNAIIEAHPCEEVRFLLQSHIAYISQQNEQLKLLNDRITVLAEHERYKEKHDALICLRGIKTLSAMTIISEIGDINRFSHPRKLVSYLGLDIAEYSSGGKERRRGITKMGNKRLRTLLVESNQILPKTQYANKTLRSRRKSAPDSIIKIAEKWDRRAFTKSYLLKKREKPFNKIKVAIAREQIGFIWETLKSC